MLKKIYVIPVSILIANLCLILKVQAQYQVLGSEELMNKMRMKTGGNVLNKVTYEDIKGSPYIFPSFTPASIITYDDKVASLPLRYDLYTGEMEVMNDARIYLVAQPKIIRMIITDSLKFIYCGFRNSSAQDEALKYSYFILKTEGKCSLLIRKNLRLQEPEKPGLYKDAKPAEFILLNDSFYFKTGENDAVKITNKKDALTVMSDKGSQVSIFIKENRINLNKIEDLQKLTEYYNSLDL